MFVAHQFDEIFFHPPMFIIANKPYLYLVKTYRFGTGNLNHLKYLHNCLLIRKVTARIFIINY